MTEEPQYEWQREDYRSFDIGETVSRAFRLIRERFFELLKLGLLLVFGPGVIVYTSEYLLAGDPTLLSALLVLFAVVMFVLGSLFLYMGYIIIYVRQLFGENINASEAVRMGASRIWPYLGASILAGLGMVAGLLALIVPMFILICGWYVYAPVVIGEKRGVTESLGRSWELTRGTKWQIFIIFIIAIICAIVIGGLMGAVSGIFVGVDAIAKLSSASLPKVLLFSAVESLSGIIGTIIGTAFVASTYYELLYLKREID